jgi:hypothetical protein
MNAVPGPAAPARRGRYVGISAIPRGKVSRAKGPVERCPLCGKFPENPHIIPNSQGTRKIREF